MAEKGTKIADQTTGESIATRDAMLPDNDANSRVVQLTDRAARPAEFNSSNMGSSGAGFIRTITTDGLDINPLPSAISNNLLDVSDADSVVVYAEIIMDDTSGASASEITVTPVYMGKDDFDDFDIAFLGQPFSLHPVNPISGDSAPTDATPFIKTGVVTEGTTSVYPVIGQIFPTLGAEKIGFHINIEGTSFNSGYLYAFKTSGAGRNAGDDIDTNTGVYGGISFFGTNS